MMTDEGKVAAINVVQVTEVTSSNAMEKEGFERFKTWPEKKSPSRELPQTAILPSQVP